MGSYKLTCVQEGVLWEGIWGIMALGVWGGTGGLGQPVLAVKGQVHGHQKDTVVMSRRDSPHLPFCLARVHQRKTTAKIRNVHLFGVSGIEILEAQS